MRTEQLECLIAIGEMCSINAASEALHLTPQAVSASIKSLEAELGLPLLQRTAKHTYLTDHGQNLVEAAKEFLLKVDALQSQKTAPQLPLMGRINLLAAPGVNNSFLPYLVCDFMSIAPELDIHIEVLDIYPLLEQLCAKTDAFGLVFSNVVDTYSMLSESFEFFPLLKCQIVAQIPCHHPLSAYNSVSIRSLLPHPILLNAASAERSSIGQLLLHYGEPAKLICMENPAIYAEMLNRGLGIGFTLLLPLKPAQTALVSNAWRAVPLKDGPSIYLSYVLRKNTLYSELTIRFLEQVAEYVKKNSHPYSTFIL